MRGWALKEHATKANSGSGSNLSRRVPKGRSNATKRVAIPRLMSAGLLLTAGGAAVDLAYHLLSDAPGAGHGSVAFTGHLVTLVGMVITLIGLLGAALTRRPGEIKASTKGEVH